MCIRDRDCPPSAAPAHSVPLGQAPFPSASAFPGLHLAVDGLHLLCGPGNDLVSATALTAAGAHLILFTTGRGTPFGAPAPAVKISTNSALAEKKPGWIDFDAGTVAGGEPLEAAGKRLYDLVLAVASGKRTRSEEMNARGIAIWKDGVTL